MNGLPLFAYLTPAPGQNQGAAMLVFLLQIAAFIAIFYFLLIRPQRQQAKRHEELLKQLKRGDEVLTAGGIVGRVVHIKEDRLTIESGESRLIVQRDRVTSVLSRGEEPAKA
ncbi:MAG TPA: preprotein translocase subunit YajC [Gemmatimonadales bacterium]|nr:preprotein translocase subunit YajC [Gemmatimonadales bacterium]